MLNMKRHVIAARCGRTSIVAVDKNRLSDFILANYVKHSTVLLGRNDLSCSGTIRDDNRTMLGCRLQKNRWKPLWILSGKAKTVRVSQ